MRAIHWASWTCVLGPEVNGIWEKYTDTSDVNATDAYFGGETLVSGDDFGLVKLFRFPSLKKGTTGTPGPHYFSRRVQPPHTTEKLYISKGTNTGVVKGKCVQR